MITKEEYITASGTYPERLKSSEINSEVLENIEKLLDAVNNLLSDLKVHEVKVSSGFRPSSVNSSVPGAAKKSGHMMGKAIDLLDNKEQALAILLQNNPELLRKYGLFLEDPQSTKGRYTNWVHLDQLVRVDRPSRIFKP